MEIIVGTIMLKDKKILMVREAKKEAYKKWAFPAGHLEKDETVFEGAKRETLEETGCKVELKKVFPILVKNDTDRDILMIHFLADLIEENLEYSTDEILETKWVSLEELKVMSKEEFRSYSVIKLITESIEKGELYPLEILKN